MYAPNINILDFTFLTLFLFAEKVSNGNQQGYTEQNRKHRQRISCDYSGTESFLGLFDFAYN